MNLASVPIAFLVLTFVTGATSTQDLPEGWRFPTRKELAGEERKESATRYAKATADFNGDGVDDEALLLKSRRFSGEALMVRLSTSDGGFTWVKLAEINWGPNYPNVDLAMGIEVIAPGVHPYACFDGAADCNYGEPRERPKLKLRDPSIAYFKFGSASSMFFWSQNHHRFMRVWTAD